MIVVHELAHLKEKDHNKAFYQLCQHMEPDYHQLEFDLRLWLTWRDIRRTAPLIPCREARCAHGTHLSSPFAMGTGCSRADALALLTAAVGHRTLAA